jgi:molybdenum cofactor cytidylyltransferase
VPGQLLLLAAGQGRRFGSDKRKARLPGGQSLLAATAQSYLRLSCPLAIVTRPEDRALQQAVSGELVAAGAPRQPRWLVASDASMGMGHSLAQAVTALRDAAPQWLIVGLGDMPFVTHETLAALVRTLNEGVPATIVRPRYQGQAGQPVGFGREHLEALTQLHGDQGARALLQARDDDVRWLDVPDPGVLADVDQRADLPTA